MTTYNEAAAFHATAEKNWDAAVAVYRQAAANFKRSKSAKNREAYVKAFDNSEAAAEICRNAQEAMRNAYLREANEALAADAAAIESLQGNLF